MARKFKKGYFVKGHFVAEGSELDEELKKELKGEGPSKTDLKAQSAALQELGEQLLTLRADLKESLDLPTRLLDALEELSRITNFEGKRRQSQYVGKIMRTLDEEQVNAIKAALEEQQQGSVSERARLHDLENWRLKLIEQDSAITELIEKYPQTDRGQLRNLVRQARKDFQANKELEIAGQAKRQSRAFRELFQLLAEIIEE